MGVRADTMADGGDYVKRHRRLDTTASRRERWMALGYVDDKDIPTYLSAPGADQFCQKDLDWFRKPSGSTVEKLHRRGTVLIVPHSWRTCCPSNTWWPGPTLRFKVGRRERATPPVPRHAHRRGRLPEPAPAASRCWTRAACTDGEPNREPEPSLNWHRWTSVFRGLCSAPADPSANPRVANSPAWRATHGPRDACSRRHQARWWAGVDFLSAHGHHRG